MQKNSFLSGYKILEIREKRRRRRNYIALAETSHLLIQSCISIEDVRFWNHWGIDLRGILRALVTNLLNGCILEGASTITQQLIRQLTHRRRKTFRRKLMEMGLAVWLEQKLSKEAILELYLNTCFLGSMEGISIYGIAKGALKIFGKSQDDLSLAEAAFLAALLRNPVSNHSSKEVFRKAFFRQHLVLSCLRERRIISRETYWSAVKENVCVFRFPKSALDTRELDDPTSHYIKPGKWIRHIKRWGPILKSLSRKILNGKYCEMIISAGRQYGIPAPFIWAVIEAESSFSEKAVSIQGAKGLMQLMDHTFQEISLRYRKLWKPEDVFRPRINIEAGALYLRELMDRYRSQVSEEDFYRFVLAAYHAGPHNVEKGIKKIREDGVVVCWGELRDRLTDITGRHAVTTFVYVEKVMRSFRAFKVTKKKQGSPLFFTRLLQYFILKTNHLFFAKRLYSCAYSFVLQQAVCQLSKIDGLVSIYLRGSMAREDFKESFDAGASDIDFVFYIESRPPEEEYALVKKITDIYERVRRRWKLLGSFWIFSEKDLAVMAPINGTLRILNPVLHRRVWGKDQSPLFGEGFDSLTAGVSVFWNALNWYDELTRQSTGAPKGFLSRYLRNTRVIVGKIICFLAMADRVIGNCEKTSLSFFYLEKKLTSQMLETGSQGYRDDWPRHWRLMKAKQCAKATLELHRFSARLLERLSMLPLSGTFPVERKSPEMDKTEVALELSGTASFVSKFLQDDNLKKLVQSVLFYQSKLVLVMHEQGLEENLIRAWEALLKFHGKRKRGEGISGIDIMTATIYAASASIYPFWYYTYLYKVKTVWGDGVETVLGAGGPFSLAGGMKLAALWCLNTKIFSKDSGPESVQKQKKVLERLLQARLFFEQGRIVLDDIAQAYIRTYADEEASERVQQIYAKEPSCAVQYLYVTHQQIADRVLQSLTHIFLESGVKTNELFKVATVCTKLS